MDNIIKDGAPALSWGECHEILCLESDKLVAKGKIARHHDIAMMAQYIREHSSGDELDPIAIRWNAVHKAWRGQHKKGITALEGVYGMYTGSNWDAWNAGWRWTPTPDKSGKYCAHWFYAPSGNLGIGGGKKIRSTEMPSLLQGRRRCGGQNKGSISKSNGKKRKKEGKTETAAKRCKKEETKVELTGE